MNTNAGEVQHITKTAVIDTDQRADFLTYHADMLNMHRGPGSVTWVASKLVPGLHPCGKWHFYRLSNGGAYIAPYGLAVRMRHPCPDGDDVYMSMDADAAGIILSAVALAWWCRSPGRNADKVRDKLDALLAYVAEHPLAEQMRRFLEPADRIVELCDCPPPLALVA